MPPVGFAEPASANPRTIWITSPAAPTIPARVWLFRLRPLRAPPTAGFNMFLGPEQTLTTLGASSAGMTRLSDSQVDRALKDLPGWSRQGDFISKAFKFRTFLAGIRFVDDVAKISESKEHHPDIHVRWTTVTLSIQTHDEGGVTGLDIDLAKEIERGRSAAK